MTSNSRHDRIVASILKLPHDQWKDAGREVLIKERDVNPETFTTLLEKVVEAMTNEADKLSYFAELMSKNLRLNPEEYPGVFELFRTQRHAQLLYDKPEMYTTMKIRTQNMAYNVGFTKLLETYNIINGDPAAVLKGCEKLCQLDDKEDIFNEGKPGTLRKNLEAMDYLLKNHTEAICALYHEYKTITTEDCVVVDTEQENRRGKRNTAAGAKSQTARIHLPRESKSVSFHATSKSGMRKP